MQEQKFVKTKINNFFNYILYRIRFGNFFLISTSLSIFFSTYLIINLVEFFHLAYIEIIFPGKSPKPFQCKLAIIWEISNPNVYKLKSYWGN